jgi:hypothetical protein
LNPVPPTQLSAKKDQANSRERDSGGFANHGGAEETRYCRPRGKEPMIDDEPAVYGSIDHDHRERRGDEDSAHATSAFIPIRFCSIHIARNSSRSAGNAAQRSVRISEAEYRQESLRMRGAAPERLTCGSLPTKSVKSVMQRPPLLDKTIARCGVLICDAHHTSPVCLL